MQQVSFLGKILNCFVCYIQANSDRTPVDEMKAAEERGAFAYRPPRTDEDGENFEDARETSPRMQVGTLWNGMRWGQLFKASSLSFC